jgi:two-component system sensor histidine kinase VicK
MEVSLELLSQDCSSHSSQRHLEIMGREIHHMAGMIKALSEYARTDLPEFKLDLVLTDPGELFDDLYIRNQDTVASQGFSFGSAVSPGLAPMAMDRPRIFNVIQNLIDNAMTHCSPEGEIRIGAAGDAQSLCFFVSDTGKGVPPELSDRIFEPLFRADASRNRHTGGTGLGLAISRKIVHHHGGSIGYRRENNTSIFEVYLPRK